MELLHRFDCGCIGIPSGQPKPGPGKTMVQEALCFMVCDRADYDDSPYVLCVRDLFVDKAAPVPLSKEASNNLLNHFNLAIAKSEAIDSLKRVMAL